MKDRPFTTLHKGFAKLTRPPALRSIGQCKTSIDTELHSLQEFERYKPSTARRAYARPLLGFGSHSSSIVTRLRAIQDFERYKISTATTSYSQLLLEIDRH